MERLFKNYDPVKDFQGGYPIVKRRQGRGPAQLGETKSGGHYEGFKDAQRALKKNLEAFKRECMDGNNSSNSGLPSGAEDWASKAITPPYDPNAVSPSQAIDLEDLLPSLPSKREQERLRRR